MKKKDISVTICTVGLIATESAMTNLEEFRPGFVSQFSPASPAETALNIIKGGAQRWNTLSYPKMEASVLLLCTISCRRLSLLLQDPFGVKSRTIEVIANTHVKIYTSFCLEVIHNRISPVCVSHVDFLCGLHYSVHHFNSTELCAQ